MKHPNLKEFIIIYDVLLFIQELLPTRQEGESRIHQVQNLADKTLTHTAQAGAQQIRRELDTLSYDWQKYISELNDAENGLQEALTAWDEYDTLYDILSKWLFERESEVKDNELKSSLADKQAQVQKYKVCSIYLANKLIFHLLE
jgi:nesprin-1